MGTKQRVWPEIALFVCTMAYLIGCHGGQWSQLAEEIN